MKNILTKAVYLTAVTLLGGVTGCVELEEEPTNFVSPDSFYETPQQIEAVFAASMNNLWDTWSAYAYQAWIEFRHTDQLNGGDLVITEDHGLTLWKIHYRSILNLNAAIGALAEGKLGPGVPEEEVQALLAQAKFLRAYNYFNLVRLFGALPLMTEDTDVLSPEITRSPVTEVYDLIISDFEVAIAGLPETWLAERQGRPARGAAQALLAKVYLTMATAPLNASENYALAAEMAQRVIDGGNYALVEDIRDVFSLATEYGPEAIWGFNSNNVDINTDPQIWTPANMGGWSDFTATPEWEEAWPDQARKDAYLLLENDEGTPYTEWDGQNVPHVRKFLFDPENYDRLVSTTNMPIIRYADVLLIFAEATNQANGGPTADAVAAINQIINRANDYQPNPNYPLMTGSESVQEFDDAVIRERNYELCFEQDRWYDIIRKRILKEVNPEWEENFSEDDYLWPIPQSDLRLNPNLEQNPGYSLPEERVGG